MPAAFFICENQYNGYYISSKYFDGVFPYLLLNERKNVEYELKPTIAAMSSMDCWLSDFLLSKITLASSKRNSFMYS